MSARKQDEELAVIAAIQRELAKLETADARHRVLWYVRDREESMRGQEPQNSQRHDYLDLQPLAAGGSALSQAARV